MKSSTAASLVESGHQLVFKKILLDAEDNFYTFTPAIPVYREGDGMCAVGKAALLLIGRQLFGDFTLQKGKDYHNLYPHIVFDVYGKVYAIMLLPSPAQDKAIRTLEEQAGKKK